MRLLVIPAILVAAIVMGEVPPVTPEHNTASAEYIDYFGYSDCIKLENRDTRVVLCPHGGRVLEYSWRGLNSLYLDPDQKAWTYLPGERTVDPCGGRFDIGPEMVIPPHPKLWLGKWGGQIIGPRSARLTSVKDEATGTQLVREFTLAEASSRLVCKQIIKNVSDETKAWCHWSRTLAAGGGICLIPLTPDSRFPHKYIMYGPGSTINYRPREPNIRARDGFLEILGTPQYPKLGMDSYAGWLCYLLKSDLLFVKRFPTFPDRVYNEVAALTISIWYYQDRMCELEPIGPREKIAPGESASFIEEWWLAPYRFPKEGEEVDLEKLQKAVERITEEGNPK